MATDDFHDNVIPFPMRPGPDRKPTSVDAAALKHNSERLQFDEILKERFSSNVLLSHEDRFIMARNMHDWLEALEKGGKLHLNALAGELFGEPKRQKLAGYRVPPKYSVVEDLDRLGSRREIVGKRSKFHRLIQVAAKMAGVEEIDGRLAVAAGTTLFPGAEDVGDAVRRGAYDLFHLLKLAQADLDAAYPMQRFFGQVESCRALPDDSKEERVFTQDFDFERWAHLAIPRVRLAYRWEDRTPISAQVRGESVGGHASLRRVLSLGYAPMAGGVTPCAVVEAELVVTVAGARTVEPALLGELSERSHASRLDFGEGAELVPWTVDGRDTSDHDDEDPPADVTIEPISPAWLLQHASGGGWQISGGTMHSDMPVPWGSHAIMRSSRFPDGESEAAVFERCFRSKSVFDMLRASYVRDVELLGRILNEEAREVEEDLAEVERHLRARIAGSSVE